MRHDALWAVSYLTDGNDEQISLAVSSGIIDIIFSTLQSSDTQLIAPSLRALGNVCTGNDDLTQVHCFWTVNNSRLANMKDPMSLDVFNFLVYHYMQLYRNLGFTSFYLNFPKEDYWGKIEIN